MSELDLSRQSKLVPPEVTSNNSVVVFGVGSVGSHVVHLLAKTGFKNIDVYDMDEVEEPNIGPQAFQKKHLGMNKVKAMKEIVEESTGTKIRTHHGQVTEDTEISPEPNTVYVCVFDSMEARKLVFDKLKEFPIIFVDGRIGRYDMRHYLVECEDSEQVEAYESSLEEGGSELVCGEKASAPINYLIAGKIVMNIVTYLKGDSYLKTHIGNAAMPDNEVNIIVNRESGVDSDDEFVEEVMAEVE